MLLCFWFMALNQSIRVPWYQTDILDIVSADRWSVRQTESGFGQTDSWAPQLCRWAEKWRICTIYTYLLFISGTTLKKVYNVLNTTLHNFPVGCLLKTCWKQSILYFLKCCDFQIFFMGRNILSFLSYVQFFKWILLWQI